MIWVTVSNRLYDDGEWKDGGIMTRADALMLERDVADATDEKCLVMELSNIESIVLHLPLALVYHNLNFGCGDNWVRDMPQSLSCT